MSVQRNAVTDTLALEQVTATHLQAVHTASTEHLLLPGEVAHTASHVNGPAKSRSSRICGNVAFGDKQQQWTYDISQKLLKNTGGFYVAIQCSTEAGGGKWSVKQSHKESERSISLIGDGLCWSVSQNNTYTCITFQEVDH